MGVNIDFKNVVDVLDKAGYKAIKDEVGKATVMGVVFTAGFSTVTCKSPALKNGEAVFESPTSLTALSKNLNNKMVITPFVTGLHKFLVAVNEKVASSAKVHFQQATAKATEEHKKEHVSLTETFKNMPTEIEENNYFGADAGKLPDQGVSHTLEIKKAKPIQQANSSLFVDAGKMPIDIFSEDMVKLVLADKLLQPVHGTSKGSTYYYIGMGLTALGGVVKIALRLRQPSDDQLVAAIRLEGAGLKDIAEEIKEHGFENSGYHASMHYTLDNLAMMRSLVAIIYNLPLQLHQTAKIY